jgi:peroxin-19
MKQLEQDMASMMGHAAKESGTTDNEGFESTVNQGADAFTKQLEESGVPPGDFLKQLLSDVMAEEGGDKPPAAPVAGAAGSQAAGSSAAPPSGGGDGAAPESFNDTIQRTIHRMQESGDKATAAATDDSDDLVAQLLKAVEAGAGAGDDGDLSKMFMGMMEQLSNKEMLYEPMKELDGKFGPWLAENRGKVAAEDMARYEKQATIVSQIVGKFEEDGYTDKDAKCRDYVWERMQEVCVLSLCHWNRLTGFIRCKRLGTRQTSLFRIRSWRISKGLAVVLRCRIVRSNEKAYS